MVRASEINQLRNYFLYIKEFNPQLDEIDLIITYCQNMIESRRQSIPLRFLNDRLTDADYFYSMVKPKNLQILSYSQWRKKK